MALTLNFRKNNYLREFYEKDRIKYEILVKIYFEKKT